MIRNTSIIVGSLVAIGMDPEVPAACNGQAAIVKDITYPEKEGRGRRNYIATVILSDESEYKVPTKFLSNIEIVPGLDALFAKANYVSPDRMQILRMQIMNTLNSSPELDENEEFIAPENSEPTKITV